MFACLTLFLLWINRSTTSCRTTSKFLSKNLCTCTTNHKKCVYIKLQINEIQERKIERQGGVPGMWPFQHSVWGWTLAVASLAWHTTGRLHGDSGTFEGRCGLLPSNIEKELMGSCESGWYKPMLTICVLHIASGTYSCKNVLIFHLEHRRRLIAHLSQHKLSQF